MVNRWKASRYDDEKGGGREASQVIHPNIDLIYLHPSYQLIEFNENTITNQGLLLVGKIVPKQTGLPEFLLRWDEKDGHLNIDIAPSTKYWRSETHGYKGHTPLKTKNLNGRIFLLNITTPEIGTVVDGTISFGLGRSLSNNGIVGSEGSLNTKLIKGQPLSDQE